MVYLLGLQELVVYQLCSSVDLMNVDHFFYLGICDIFIYNYVK